MSDKKQAISDKTSDSLLPCPFCGGEAELSQEDCYGNTDGDWMVFCGRCSLQFGFTSQFETTKEAIQAWNTRKPVDAVLERLEEEKENALKLWDNNSRYMGYEHSIEIIKEKLIWERESIEDK